MKLSELLQGVEVLASTAPAAWEITGVAYDSRQVQPGECLCGDFRLCNRRQPLYFQSHGPGRLLGGDGTGSPEPVPYVQVASARGALASMGANWYGHPAQGMTMVGGHRTNGKTSVTLLLKTVLEQVTGAKVGPHRHHPKHDWPGSDPHRADHPGELCAARAVGPDG